MKIQGPLFLILCSSGSQVKLVDESVREGSETVQRQEGVSKDTSVRKFPLSRCNSHSSNFMAFNSVTNGVKSILESIFLV